MVVDTGAVVLFVFWPVVKVTLYPEVDFIRSNGTVEGEEVNISRKIEGRISRAYYHEGDAVRKGDTLIQLADEDLLAKVKLQSAVRQSFEPRGMRAIQLREWFPPSIPMPTLQPRKTSRAVDRI